MKPEDWDAIAGRVRAGRRQAQLSQEDLQELSGLSLGVISKLESGGHVELATVVKIARALETSVGSLLGEDAPSIDAELPGWGDLPGDHRRVIRELVATYAAAHALTGASRTEQDAGRPDVPGWDQLTPQEQDAYRRAEVLRDRAERLTAAEDAGEQHDQEQPGGPRRRRGG